MNLASVAMFIVRLKDRAQEQIDNTLLAQLLHEHGLFLFLPIIEYCYLVSRNVENISFNFNIVLAIINVGCIIILNCNHCLVNRKNSVYIVSRADSPERVDSILDECADRSANVETSTRMYVLWWKSFPGAGHLSMQLFDEKKTFLSHWPDESIKFTDPTSVKRPVASAPNDSAQKDVDEESCKPDYIITIPEGILAQRNIDEMIGWYNNKYTTNIYKGKLKNCADCVKQSLKAGKFYLANPSLRLFKLGLSIPNDIADRIVYTLCLRHSSRQIRFLHHALTVAVWSLTMHLVAVLFGLLKPYIPAWFATILFNSVCLQVYHLFRALD